MDRVWRVRGADFDGGARCTGAGGQFGTVRGGVGLRPVSVLNSTWIRALGAVRAANLDRAGAGCVMYGSVAAARIAATGEGWVRGCGVRLGRVRGAVP